jgi:hypothetical protein
MKDIIELDYRVVTFLIYADQQKEYFERIFASLINYFSIGRIQYYFHHCFSAFITRVD